jgi:GntR family transcriptional regulator
MADASTPLYQQVMQSILDRIDGGVYRVGERIDSERDLARAFGINRLTVRKAIAELSDQGYLRSVQGKGTYVLPKPQEKQKVQFGNDREEVSLSAALRQSGFSSSRVVLSFSEVAVEGMLAELFGDSKTCYELIRLSRIDDTPYALQDCFFPADVFSYPERFDFAEGSLYTYMDLQGHAPDLIISNMQAASAPARFARALEVDEEKILFFDEYTSFDKDRRIIEYTTAYYRPEYTSYHFTRVSNCDGVDK